MRISATEEYGLRCILQLARLDKGVHLSASNMAELEGISVQYASKMMHLFRKANLVAAERGLHGGFSLARAASEINLLQVFHALGRVGGHTPFCEKYSGDRKECIHMDDCSVRPVWQVLLTYFDSVLEKLSLADLVQNEMQTKLLVTKKAQEFSSLVAQKPILEAATVVASQVGVGSV